MATLVFYLEDATSMTHSLEPGTTTIGRHPDSVIVLNCASVSGHHAIVELQDDGCYVIDQQSSNGTRVNGANVEEAKLKEGDRVGFGDIQAVFYQGKPPSERPAEAPITKTVISIPPPSAASKARAKEKAPANFRPGQPRPAQARPARPVGRPTGYPDQSGSGCATALIVMLLFLTAFMVGLYMRHHKETDGGNFFSDVMSKISGTMPKIKVEK